MNATRIAIIIFFSFHSIIGRAQCGDSCITSTMLTVATSSSCSYFSCTTSGATLSGMNAFPCGNTPNRDVWFSFTVPAGDSTVAIHVVGGGIGTLTSPVIYLYRGSCSALSYIACQPGSPPASSALLIYSHFIPGEQIYIRVMSYPGTPDGAFQICVFDPCLSAGVPNDDPCSASFLPLSPTCSSYVAFNNTCATATLGINPGCGATWNEDIWVKTVIGPSGWLDLKVQKQSITSILCGVYTGNCNALTPVSCQQDPNFGLHLDNFTPGDTAWIRLGTSANGRPGHFSLCLSDPCSTGPALFDEPCNAFSMPVVATCSGYTTLSTNCATSSDTMVPNPGCGGNISADIWVQTTIDTTGVLEVNLVPYGSADFAAALYSGSCSSLSLVVCDDDFGPQHVPRLFAQGLVPGSTIWIRIWVKNGTDGTIDICLTNRCSGGGPKWAFDDPPCPLPNNTTYYAPVQDGLCNYILYSSFCTINNFTNAVSGITIPSGCSGPFYQPADTTGWDLWVPFIVPDSPVTGQVAINTLAGTIDLDIGVYRVTSPVNSGCSTGSNYTLLGCDDLSGPGIMPYMSVSYGGTNAVQPGDTLFIRCWGFNNGPRGTWYMCLANLCSDGLSAPGYDDPPCTHVVELPVTTGTCYYYTPSDNICATATTNPGDPGCANWNNGRDTWFVVTLPASGQIEINFQTGHTLNDPALAVYSGIPVSCGGAGLSLLGCDDDAGPGLLPYFYLNNSALAAQQIYIRVWGMSNQIGTFALCLNTSCSGPSPWPPLFDDPPCPMPGNASSYVMVPVGTCHEYFEYDISCADAVFSNNPPGMPVPQDCSPNYPLAAATGRDVWIPMILPDTPSVGFLDISVRGGTVADPDIALYRIVSPIDSNCSSGLFYLLDTCADFNGPTNRPYIHLPYGGTADIREGDTVLIRMWTHLGLYTGTWAMSTRITDWSLQDVCLVTVDTATGRNVVVWDPPTTSAISGLVIRREAGMQGNYLALDTVSTTGASVFTDLNSHAQVSAYRYGLAVLDSCGHESSVGQSHQTMHLTVAPSSPGWTLTWNDYEGFTYSYVYILRGTSSGNMAIIDSVPYGQMNYTDTLPVTGNSLYLVEVRKVAACYPVPFGTYASSFSNTVSAFTVGMTKVIPLARDMLLFPNPVSHRLEISFRQLVRAQTNIRISDFTGREVVVVLQETLPAGAHKLSWDAIASGVADGIYFVRLESGGFIETKKIVVMK